MRRVYMHFHYHQGWHVQFLEADLKTSLPRRLTFTDPEKIHNLARRDAEKPGATQRAGRCWSTLSIPAAVGCSCG